MVRINIGSNENPYGPGEPAIAALVDAGRRGNRYQDYTIEVLTARISQLHGVPPDHVLVTAGSTALIVAATKTFTSPGRALVVPAPTFELPTQVAREHRAPVIALPVDPLGTTHLEAMTRTPRAGLIYISNPNNPTGGCCPADALVRLAAVLHRTSLTAHLLIDEAYIEYAEPPQSVIRMPLDNPAALVCRTFSKIHGLAGLRLGYAVARPNVLAALRAHMSWRGVSGPAALAAAAALDDCHHVERQAALNREAREFTRRAFEEAGYAVLPSQANFVMVDVRHDAADFKTLCADRGVDIARPFPPLSTCARLTIGSLADMQKATDIMLSILSTLPSPVSCV